MVITTVLRVIGFLVHLMSVTTPQQNIGLLLASTIILAPLCALPPRPTLALILKPLSTEVLEPTATDVAATR